MESLLYGQIIDTLKCLSFDQLFALKQTNKYFNNFIGRYEHLLARKEFYQIYFIIDEDLNNYKIIDLNSGLFNFTLNNTLEKKWKSAIDKKFPTYVRAGGYPFTEYNTGDYPYLFYNKKIILALDIKENNNEKKLILNLPLFPKNIDELKIIYCWLFHLSRCGYSNADFLGYIFNPELIQLLFEENKENIQIKFHLKVVFFNFGNPTNVLKFTLEHLIIEQLFLSFEHINTDTLSKLVLNGGDIIRELNLQERKKPIFHNLIIKNLEESKDCSKIVAKIFINFKDCPRINLIIRAEDIKKTQNGDRHYIKYELSNIYNPNVRYSIINVEENGVMKNVIIQRIN